MKYSIPVTAIVLVLLSVFEKHTDIVHKRNQLNSVKKAWQFIALNWFLNFPRDINISAAIYLFGSGFRALWILVLELDYPL